MVEGLCGLDELCIRYLAFVEVMCSGEDGRSHSVDAIIMSLTVSSLKQ